MSDSLHVSLVQTELLWENVSGNLNLLDQKLEGLTDTDLIVLPEMFSTGFTMNPKNLAESMDGRMVQWMLGKSDEKNAVICGSAIISENGNFHNRFIAAYPDGSVKTYDKKHLFTLAEEDKPYTSGKERVLLEIKGWKILPLICYDLRFPVWARSQQAEGSPWEYDALVYVANWPKPRINAWDTLLQARAIENQAYCIGVNRIGTDANGLEYIGHSAVYDYAGLPVINTWETDVIKSCVLSKNEMTEFREKLPFQKDGDGFELV